MINIKFFNNSKLVKRLLYLITGLTVFLFIGIFSGVKAVNQHKKLIKTQNENENLNRKLEILKTLGAELSKNTDPVSSALMDTNPTPVVVNQLRRLAQERGLIIGNFKSNARLEDKDLQMASAVIDFKVEGPFPVILDFLKDVENKAPITTFSKVNIFSTTNVQSGAITLNAYWANYPKSLPPVDSGSNKLTDKEEELLVKLISFKQPLINSVIPQPPKFRSDPFLQF